MDLDGLPTDLEQFVQQEIAEGKFATIEEVVGAALRMFREHEARGGNSPSAPNGMTVQRPVAQMAPEDIIYAIKRAFETDSPRLAERLAKEGAERYPKHAELQKYARVLAPPTVRLVPSTPESRAAVKANSKWLKAHRNEYVGNWIALQNGQLLHVSSTFDDLIAAVGEVHGRSILVTKISS